MKTMTGTLAEAFGRIVAILPEGALVVTYRGDVLSHARMRLLGLGIGDNATFTYDPCGKFAAIATDDGDCEGETGLG